MAPRPITRTLQALPSPTSSITSTSTTSSSSSSSSSSQHHQPTARTTNRGKLRVTAEHTLTRVRENQRRHRARRRDYISTLETKLEQAEKRLASALAEIEELKRERDGLGGGAIFCDHEDREEDIGAKLVEGGLRYTDEEIERRESPVDIEMLEDEELGGEVYADFSASSSSSPSPSYSSPTPPFSTTATTPYPPSTPPTLPIEPLLTIPTSPQPSQPAQPTQPLTTYPLLPPGPPPCCTDTEIPLPTTTTTTTSTSHTSTAPIPTPTTTTTTTPSSSPSSSSPQPAPSPPAPPSPECTTCHTRPAPLPTESTTLCAQAYILIQQQNFRGIDAATIRRWLYRGYRRAVREGEGCRVENGVLFRLLDFISGV